MRQDATELRERLLGAIDAGLPQAEAARRFGVCPRTIVRWRRRWRTTGAAWWADTAQLDPARLVFVDERGTTLSLTPRDGRAPRSQRVVGGVPRTHGPNITLFAAMSGEGITAAMTMTGPAAGAVWELCVRQILVPSRRPGQIVSLDQLGVHQHRAVRQLIAVHGCHVRFLPPYSPDFSPIEHAFSTLTTALRHAGARTRPTREDAIATGLATITPHDAGAWFRHRGSALPEQLF